MLISYISVVLFKSKISSAQVQSSSIVHCCSDNPTLGILMHMGLHKSIYLTGFLLEYIPETGLKHSVFAFMKRK